MITKITKDNRGAYDALFAAASADLGLTEEQYISSLDEYFYNFPQLSALPDNVYKVLPLDESFFEIDADTRIIKIPDAFKKNGISVQGDQDAEIIFFTIDRYFDTVDLNSTTPIIQWEVSANKAVTTGVSPVLFKDIDILGDQNKLIFGWAINNTITKNSGNVKFAVRFYRTDAEDNLVFSLSTLTATASISPALDFEFNAAGVDNSFVSTVYTDDRDLIQARYQWANEISRPATSEAPTFDVPILTAADALETAEEGGVTLYIVDFEDGSNARRFIVKASAENTTNINYLWYKRANSSSDWNIAGEDKVVYEPVPAGTAIDNSESYYLEVVAGTTYEPYTIPSGVTNTNDIDDVIFIKKHYYDATTIGDYKVVAKNNKGKIPGATESEIVRIPGASPFTLGENTTSVIFDELNHATLVANASVTNERDTLTYQWSKKVDGTFVPQEGTTSSLALYNSLITDSEKKLFDDTYQVAIQSNRNNNVCEEVTNEGEDNVIEYRVTYPAAEFDSVAVSADRSIINITRGQTAKISLNFGTNFTNKVCDKIEFQWFKVYINPELDEPDLTDRSDDIALAEPVLVAPTDVAATAYTADVDGKYYCKLRNFVNGTYSEPIYTETIAIDKI